MRRVVLPLLIATIGTLGFSVIAEAHALVASSVPAGGATLDRAPTQISITFTEAPDTRLSVVHILNSGGQHVELGPMRPAAGDPKTVTVALPKLPNGVYTVTWTTVSAVDGHYASGFFTFGVGISPAGASPPVGASPPSTPGPSPLGVAGRWIYYVGLGLLIGGTWISLFAFAEPVRRLRVMALAGSALGLIGLTVTTEAQREAAHINWGDVFATSLGGNLIKQAVPVALAAAALGVAWRLPAARQRAALGIAGAAALLAIVAHTLTTHADASHMSWLMIPAQWAHLAAFAVWIGGLSALLLGIQGLPAQIAARAVRRFSFVAGFALVAIAATGLLRAIDEVGSFARLASTLFGNLVLVKVALFLALASLGAINRYRNVPRAEWSLRGLMRVGRVEIGLAAVVIGVAAVLTALAPPSYSTAVAAPSTPQIVAAGQDFGTTVRVRLVITPGYPGSNRFTVSVRDYDTGQPVSASRVALRFAFPGRPSVGESTLALKSQGNGTYSAAATNLSLAGRWSTTVVIERSLESVEIPLTVTTAVPPQHLTIQRTPGLPDIYIVAFGGNRSLEMYVDPGSAGYNSIHATFFQGSAELQIQDGAVISATPDSGPTVDLQAARFQSDTVGHFIGQGPLAAGKWRFDVTGTSVDGVTYQASFEETIK